MATATGHAVYQIECCILGYHVYHWIWHPIIGEVLGTTHERENEHDRYAVAVLEEETCVVGHLPCLISHECYFFLRTGGTITAEVTGRRWHSNLPDRGLDIPCIQTLRHKEESVIDKEKLLLKKKMNSNSKEEKKEEKQDYQETYVAVTSLRCCIYYHYYVQSTSMSLSPSN